ncbi:hypothetical protein Tco_0618008 [Tanacetum coccineum]
MPRKSFDTLVDNLHDVMVKTLPAMVDKHIKEKVVKQVPEQERRSYMSGHILHVHPAQSQTSSVPDQQYQLNTVLQTACITPIIRRRDRDDPHDDAHPEGENSAKRQKTSEYEAYVSRESSSRQVFQEEQAPSTLGNQEQDDNFDFWTDSYASDDDEIPTKCTSGDDHQYHIDQMKNFLKSDIVWESRKEILISPHPQKTTPLVHSCQKDHEAPALSLINQDLLYLKKGNSGPEKIVLSLHKFPAIIFNDDDIEERTSRWVNKGVKKFNPYARYGVEHWKNPHAKIFYIRKQKDPGKSKEEIYSNLKIIQPDYKNLNKNDIEGIYLLIMNGKVPDYADTGLLWSLLVFIRSIVIWERVHDFQLGIESYQQKVNLTAPIMTFLVIKDHEIVLEGLKSYNNDVKYGYVQKDLTKEEAKYLKLFEEEIEERLKHQRESTEEDQGDDEEVVLIDSNEDGEKKDDTNDDKSINLEMTDDEETEDEFIHSDEQVNDDEDEEMSNVEVEDSRKGDAEISDVTKEDAEKIEEIKDDAKKAELPPTSSSLSVSLGFSDQFLKLSPDTSLVSTIKDTIDAEINSLLDIKIQSEIPHIQSPSVLIVPVSVIFEPSVLTTVQETPSVAPVTSLPPPSVSTIHLYLTKQQHQSLHHQSQLMLQPSPLLSLNPIHLTLFS